MDVQHKGYNYVHVEGNTVTGAYSEDGSKRGTPQQSPFPSGHYNFKNAFSPQPDQGIFHRPDSKQRNASAASQPPQTPQNHMGQVLNYGGSPYNNPAAPMLSQVPGSQLPSVGPSLNNSMV